VSAALAEAIARGGVVDVPPGRHPLSVQVTKDVVLRGAGATLVAAEGPVLSIDGAAQVSLEGLSFEGRGVDQRTGALRVHSCSFSRGAAPRFGGGALCAAGAQLEVRQCRFDENSGRQGGALLLDGEVEAVVYDSLFAHNVAVQGGAVRVREGAQVTFVGCTFVDNRAVAAPGQLGTGATLYLSGSLTRQPRVLLENCLVVPHGGPSTEVVHGEVHGSLSLRHCVVPPSLQALAGEGCRVASPELHSDFSPPRHSEVECADRAVWARVASVDLLGRPRGASVGALVAR
jgi:hypothetical protein